MGSSCCGVSDPFGREVESSFPSEKRYFRKMNYHKPTEVTKGVNIKRNPKTGLYQGFPKEWAENHQIGINVDQSKTVVTSHLSSSIRPDPVLPTNILNKIESTQQKPARLQGYQKVPKYINAGKGSFITNSSSNISSKNRDY